MLSKVEIDILKILSEHEMVDQMNSMTVSKISEKIKLNIPRVRANIKHLLSLNCIAMGFKDKSSYTYFITKIGQEKSLI